MSHCKSVKGLRALFFTPREGAPPLFSTGVELGAYIAKLKVKPNRYFGKAGLCAGQMNALFRGDRRARVDDELRLILREVLRSKIPEPQALERAWNELDLAIQPVRKGLRGDATSRILWSELQSIVPSVRWIAVSCAYSSTNAGSSRLLVDLLLQAQLSGDEADETNLEVQWIVASADQADHLWNELLAARVKQSGGNSPQTISQCREQLLDLLSSRRLRVTVVAPEACQLPLVSVSAKAWHEARSFIVTMEADESPFVVELPDSLTRTWRARVYDRLPGIGKDTSPPFS